MSKLKPAALLFIPTWLLHTADHIRRTTEMTSDGVIWAGTGAAVLAAVAITLILTEHRTAPLVAVAAFGSLAIGTATTHLAPSWGYFSEPLLFGSAADTWALAAAVPEIVVAFWLAWLGFGIARENGFQLEQSKGTQAGAV